MADRHDHEATVHGHTHHHVVHYLTQGQEWTHLMATHDHEHNHPQVDHIHGEHEDEPKEHEREGHIHDHSSPTESPG
jgi:hypothetical protein